MLTLTTRYNLITTLPPSGIHYSYRFKGNRECQDTKRLEISLQDSTSANSAKVGTTSSHKGRRHVQATKEGSFGFGPGDASSLLKPPII